MATIDRRSFLKLTGGVALAGNFANALQEAERPGHPLGSDPAPGRRRRRLLVVDLQGGNDGLRTFTPATGQLRDLRPTLALSDRELINFRGLPYGVNPAISPLRELWNHGQLMALYGTGISGQGRSHFVAQDVWRTARLEQPASSGWLGRWLEASATSRPNPLRAVLLGQTSVAANNEAGRPVAVESVKEFRLLGPRETVDPELAFSEMAADLQPGLFGQAQASISRTVDAVGELQGLVANVSEGVDEASTPGLFAMTQAMIQADLPTEIVYMTIDGFDTHSLQIGRQDGLLAQVSKGLADLFQALGVSGHAQDTLAIVVSEFGRRVAENGSGGTDHGKGGLSFLCGPPVRQSTVIGEPDLRDLDDGDLRITIDAREMYDSALRWLGASDDQVVDVLGGEWNEYSLLQS